VGGDAVCTTPAQTTFVELMCPEEWAACQANTVCHQQFTTVLASPDRPAFGNGEVTALFACLTQARESGASAATGSSVGCIDPSAMNYAPAAVLDDQTCMYSCTGMISYGSLPEDTACYTCGENGDQLHSYPIQLSAGGLENDEGFWNSLGQGNHVIIQGPIVQGSLGAGSVGGGACNLDLLNDALSWDDAELACIVEGGHLATILDEAQHELVDALVSDDDTIVWIGTFSRYCIRIVQSAPGFGPFITFITRSRYERHCIRVRLQQGQL
jgi:hypothetical protein